jgi:hypothetical protein
MNKDDRIYIITKDRDIRQGTLRTDSNPNQQYYDCQIGCTWQLINKEEAFKSFQKAQDHLTLLKVMGS